MKRGEPAILAVDQVDCPPLRPYSVASVQPCQISESLTVGGPEETENAKGIGSYLSRLSSIRVKDVNRTISTLSAFFLHSECYLVPGR